ncbi:conserved hypothetical protein [Magnetospirillum sp. LM-5]|uniref:hypothetical protein n=1 Tax=Magnetospirillum sp. LM-5 TaxID=2681466 RepID=UPI00138272A8|nr:hypothetical protein [Magnetospirillum sp. LM-5]CAA7619574.1 conserved hypothetical protein [Magnetospirillum sp. LM-5]
MTTPKPAYEIAAGSFVTLELDGVRALCLKAERIGKEHTNHFLVVLEPRPEPGRMALRYIDPELPLVPVDGVSLAFSDGPERTPPEIGDAFANRTGLMLKVKDDAKSQRYCSYVEIATGLVRPRMEHGIIRLMGWSVQRL